MGLTRNYDFIIDKYTGDDPDSMVASANRFLVARLAAIGPAPEARILSEGRAAGLAFLSQTGSWLPDHSYEQADLALREGQSGRVNFAGIDGSLLHADTGSHVNIHATRILAGHAAKRDDGGTSRLLGGFLEVGYSDYHIRGNFGPAAQPEITGGGYLSSYGAGAMLRLRRESGLRAEASLRAGWLDNHFHSRDLADPNGVSARYDIRVPYLGAHAGLGYEMKINDDSRLDFLARYFWTWQDGVTATLPTDERVTFLGAHSHRLRAGARYTWGDPAEYAWYGGAYGEFEFDGRSRAGAYGHSFDTPDMGGLSGVGEIGLIRRSPNSPRRTIELGLHAYVGKLRGVSGGFRLGWEF
jgi:hypothetical protein